VSLAEPTAICPILAIVPFVIVAMLAVVHPAMFIAIAIPVMFFTFLGGDWSGFCQRRTWRCECCG
jgi:hypothetical protein